MSTMTTHKGPPATGRTTRLKRVRNRTIDAIEWVRTTTDLESTWIDQHDAIVSAGLQALGYPPLDTPKRTTPSTTTDDG